MKKRIVPILLSILMVCTLFVPITSVSATAVEVDIAHAEDNGGTAANAHASAAVPALKKPGDLWYSINFDATNNPVPPMATFTLGQEALVEAVDLMFLNNHQRTYTFSLESSLDGETWDECLPTTASTQQAVEMRQTFTLPEAVTARYVRIVAVDGALNVNVEPPTRNQYFALKEIAVIGTVDPSSELTPADYTAVDTLLDRFAQLTASDYSAASWKVYTDLKADIEAAGILDYTEQATVDQWAVDLATAFDGLVPAGQALTIIAAENIEGACTDTGLPRAAVPNLRQEGDGWYAGGRNTQADGRAISVYILEIESTISAVSITWYNGHSRTYDFAIETSLDNENWTERRPMSHSTLASSAGAASLYAFSEPFNALYIKIIGNGNTSSAAPNYTAFSNITIMGEEVPGGAVAMANYTLVRSWVEVFRDLTPSLYTPESWKVYTDILPTIDYDYDRNNQSIVDGYAAALQAAYVGLTFVNLDELQIAQSFWSTDPGSPAWTDGAIIFNEGNYTLDQFTIKYNEAGTPVYRLQYWTRITAEPVVGKENTFVITNIILGETFTGTYVDVTDAEVVPEGGFIFCFHAPKNSANYALPEFPIEGGSQYGSLEFGRRNREAFIAMDLAVDDEIQLNNVLLDPSLEGGDVGGAVLDTTGTWIHRYALLNGQPEGPTPTAIYRRSSTENPEAVEGGPQYLTVDEFRDFTTASTITKAASYIPGDCNGDGKVGIDDLTDLAKSVAGWTVDINLLAADCNGDGKVGIDDVTDLAKSIAGWNITLVPGKAS